MLMGGELLVTNRFYLSKENVRYVGMLGKSYRIQHRYPIADRTIALEIYFEKPDFVQSTTATVYSTLVDRSVA